MTEATSIISSSKGNSLVPRTLEEAMKFSTTLSQSELVPKDFIGKPANILVAIQWGMELGLQPMQAMQSIAVINGRPSLWGDAVIGLVRSSGLCEYIYEEIDDAGQKATCRTRRKGDEHEVSRTFTMDDAKKAGLQGKQGPWSNYPKRMLQMRARSWCLRDVYPDVLRGVSVVEEAQDHVPEKDVTPQPGTPAVEQPQSKSAPAAVDAEIVTAASEKTAAGAAEKIVDPPAEKKPEAPSSNGKEAGKPMLEGQLRIIRAKLAHAAMNETDLLAKFGKVEDLKFEQFDEIQAWIAERQAALVTR